MGLPRLSRNDIDISAKRVKSNLNSFLTFEQFVAVMEDLILKQIGGYDSFSTFIDEKLDQYSSLVI